MVTKKVLDNNEANTEAPKASKEPKRIEVSPEMANNLFNSEKQRYESIMKERARVENFLLETEKTEFALKEISETKSDDIFVNLGSGVYVAGKVLDSKKVKFQVGNQVFLEKSSEEILKELTERKEKLIKDLQELHKVEYQSQQNLNNLYKFLMNASKSAKAHDHSHDHTDNSVL